MVLSERYLDALRYAAQLHAQQMRKGSGIPYLSHLLAVSAIVLENGGDEDQAIAALLHDAVEDQGGLATLEVIQQRYGGRVARLVKELSDSFVVPKPPWRERKSEYLEHLHQASPDVLLISLSDKLHNARSLVRDYREQGDSIWARFKGGREGVLWYYRELADFFRSVVPGWLSDELERAVRALEDAAGQGNP